MNAHGGRQRSLPYGWVQTARVVCFAHQFRVLRSQCYYSAACLFLALSKSECVAAVFVCLCLCACEKMPKLKRQCKERTCFVPLCKSGYRSNTERVSLFTAPSDVKRLAEWARMIKRTDRRLTPTAVVCEKHFESSLIERAFSVTVNGVVHEIPRDKPRLKPDAVPTIFPEYPKHLVPKVPVKRKTRNLCEQDLKLPSKRRKRGESAASELCSAIEGAETESLEGVHQNAAVPEECIPRSSFEAASAQNDGAQRLQNTTESRHPFSDLSIPVAWMKVPSLPAESVAYAYCEAEINNFATLFIEKMVLFEKPLPERQSVVATVYLRGREKSKQVLTTRDEAESLIKNVSLTVLCGGCGLKPASKKHTSYRDMYFAEKCLLSTKSGGESCVFCKYQRVLAQNQACRRKKREKASAGKHGGKKHCKNISRNLSRTKKRLATAEEQVAHMKEQNEAVSEEAFENKIKSLPHKQQLAVKNCFLAARRKSHKGMRYNDEWIVECMMMKMRSPKLYEHLRRETIMVLPGRTCLQRYLQRFKGGFGLSANIFNALTEKTKAMDVYSRHGGLVIDEIKLSEHLNVKSAGE
ncbi:uncharacterized protein [Dermacentor andersoni]|uniref:uncharacterized protein n=1 Tax=Dermacentor andersoni TaxID=34620 RepID=UPI003B3BA041